MKTIITLCAAALVFILAGCVSSSTTNYAERDRSYAVYAEYAQTDNKLMQDGLNRRVFTKHEAEHGEKIKLLDDGSITLDSGTYHISGFSLVTMQVTMAPVNPPINFPGYCMVYYKKDENSGHQLLQKQLCLGTGATSEGITPSLFDLIYTCDSTVNICVGHQVGDNLQNQVYKSVFKVGQDTSSYHVFARINIMEL